MKHQHKWLFAGVEGGAWPVGSLKEFNKFINDPKARFTVYKGEMMRPVQKLKFVCLCGEVMVRRVKRTTYVG